MTDYNDPYNATFRDEYPDPASGRKFHLNDNTGKGVWLEPPRRPDAAPPPPPKKNRRVFIWFFVVVQALFLAWVVSGVSSRGSVNCDALSAADCAAAHKAGKGIGVGLLLLTWAAADVLLWFGYAIYRLTHR